MRIKKKKKTTLNESMWKNTDWHHSELIQDYLPKMFDLGFVYQIMLFLKHLKPDRTG